MIQAGLRLEPTAPEPITLERLRAYALASGDPNPIHLDDAVARRAGLPGVIAHGMLVASFVAERARRFSSERGCEIAHSQTRFRAMTLPGQEISVVGVVKRASEDECVLELEAKDGQGEVKVSSVVKLRRV